MIGERTAHVRHLLAPWIEAGIFGPLEIHAAERIAGACVPRLALFDVLSVACAIWSTQQGHVCFDLDDTSVWNSLPMIHHPDTTDWREYLSNSPLALCVNDWDAVPDTTRPLVVRGRSMYLARQWIDEGVVADHLRRRRALSLRSVDRKAIDSLFAPEDRDGRQYQGVVRSLEARTSILTGGPGTGKTYTIARILVAAVRHGVQSIALAAPTAKAAVQMRDSLTAALASDIPGLDEGQRRLLERVEPSTIHRLLGHRPGTATRFHHDSTRRLPHELIVVDEMSMVSLPLMARLLDAVDSTTTLVLVGDPGQLDSVENGSVLRDLTDIDLGPSIPTTVLQGSRRNIGTQSNAFAEAVRFGDADRALTILGGGDEDGSLQWVETPDPLVGVSALADVIGSWHKLRESASRGDLEAIVQSVNEARVLCAHRDGPYGVEVWNQELSRVMVDSRDRWRVGDIVVKTRNDLGQGLANGDVGVVARVEGALVFVFRHGDSAVIVPVAVDDAVELAFATTVHKAQGSEFAAVAVVVPPAESPLNTRELLYTAMTRAKPRAILIGTRQDVIHAVSTVRRRWSGLAERLTAE